MMQRLEAVIENPRCRQRLAMSFIHDLDVFHVRAKIFTDAIALELFKRFEHIENRVRADKP